MAIYKANECNQHQNAQQQSFSVISFPGVFSKVRDITYKVARQINTELNYSGELVLIT